MNSRTALLDIRQMHEAERLTVGTGLSETEVMENGGAAVAREIVRRWPARPVTVLCGPGRNGGDGFVVAGSSPRPTGRFASLCSGRRDRLAGEAQLNAGRWRGTVEPLSPDVADGADLVVDAIFGAGLDRPLKGPAAATLARAASEGLPIVAIDVPSGLMSDTGEAAGAVATVLTVTFFRKRPGHVLLPGRSLCGEVVVADVGIPSSVLERVAPDTFENDPGPPGSPICPGPRTATTSTPAVTR